MTLYLPETNCCLQSNVSLASHTSLRVGGRAQWYVEPKTTEQLQDSLQWAKQEQLAVTFLGGGSNLLISDRGLSGLVISARHFRNLEINEETAQITASAGTPLATVAWKAAKRGWSGLEWAVGIPGTVGGSVVMNAGAHGASMENALVKVVLATPNGTLEEVSPDSLNFCYRTSDLQHSPRWVMGGTFQLHPGYSREEILQQTRANLNQRRTTQPYDKPSCGSVFRNPQEKAAAWLIEQAGLKGFQVGDAQVAHRHANFILNQGQATAQDIYNVIQHVQEKVEQRWSILLHPEVKLLGEF
ncbi:UDP-N-acetylmuramate dehydrogenase [Euhalothece natronophila Z-M001]|uniref:UDP-N-acetylenolpyruvoylglucosamine reductase n=1 Tax=Euhalothece natronophila Z-M001 TaxID=522448 RepID=A0A5B8NNQ4_9CHRO|nr:UDP-N-acetylmuramate dehydrogenase [Euhalothece natronophila]QDZ40923.1 UDP-N-acetylmuramate dehydrogenase [Euhalothece natronophila Z-M001]